MLESRAKTQSFSLSNHPPHLVLSILNTNPPIKPPKPSQQPTPRPNQTKNLKMQLPTALLRRSIALARPNNTHLVTATRPFSSTLPTLARKDAQDKDSLKPLPNEYSKSGSDDAAAATEKAAFDPSSTRPEEEQATAAKESGGDVSFLFLPNKLSSSPTDVHFADL